MKSKQQISAQIKEYECDRNSRSILRHYVLHQNNPPDARSVLWIWQIVTHSKLKGADSMNPKLILYSNSALCYRRPRAHEGKSC